VKYKRSFCRNNNNLFIYRRQITVQQITLAEILAKKGTHKGILFLNLFSNSINPRIVHKLKKVGKEFNEPLPITNTEALS